MDDYAPCVSYALGEHGDAKVEEKGFGGLCLGSKWMVNGSFSAGMVALVLGAAMRIGESCVCEPLRTGELTIQGPLFFFLPSIPPFFITPHVIAIPFLFLLLSLSSFFLCHPHSCSLPQELSSWLALCCRDRAGRGTTHWEGQRVAQGKHLPNLKEVRVLPGSRKQQLFRCEELKFYGGP